MPINQQPTNLVWLDLETTGIDVETRKIIEIATIITDRELNVLEEGPDLIIHQPDGVLEAMDEWCVKQHGESGLTQSVKESSISLREAERQTLEFVARHCPPKACPLCGNSICFDRRFIMRYMPALNAHLNYRNVDVSSIKELAYRWYPSATQRLEKDTTHRAMDDIRESIDELRHYRRVIFRGPDA
jgi:oligoribonuclease